jgi:glycogen debranching enzyme
MSPKAVEYRQAEITRRRKALVASPIADSFAQSLAAASDQYLVSRGDEKTVIAGYHWFGDWGRRHYDRPARPHVTNRQV